MALRSRSASSLAAALARSSADATSRCECGQGNRVSKKSRTHDPAQHLLRIEATAALHAQFNSYVRRTCKNHKAWDTKKREKHTTRADRNRKAWARKE
eukprot:365250-Chlamydomonas_euryale.AAC.9